MIVCNEADRYLPRVLGHALRYVEEAMILDDVSADDTVETCKSVLRDVPHRIVSLPDSLFHEEHRLRRLQWELARDMRPDWILALDADEIFEGEVESEIRSLVDQDSADLISFRMYDMWDEGHYREDARWRAHLRRRPFLVRNLPELSDEWRTASLPSPVTGGSGRTSEP